MSSSMHVHNKRKNMLILCERLFVNATKVYQFKAKELEIKDDALCLGNISKDFTINNLKKQD